MYDKCYRYGAARKISAMNVEQPGTSRYQENVCLHIAHAFHRDRGDEQGMNQLHSGAPCDKVIKARALIKAGNVSLAC